MKKIFLMLGILLTLFLSLGFGCSKEDEIAGKIIDNNPITSIEDNNDFVIGDEGNVLVDRIRYVQAGKPPFDFTNIIFHQKKGNGYKVEVSSDKNLKVEIMTDKDCLLKAEKEEYKIIDSDEGSNVVLTGEKLEGENRNLCAEATASGVGETQIKFKVVELI